METAALVAREAAEIRDLNQLLTRVVHLISERFGFYHAGIFLLDERKEYAVLQAVNSEGGERMLARGHKLQVGKVGVVGYAAGMAEPRIAQDVGADVTYYDNPDMPNTRSEMALPLIVRGNVIGVLDVQSIVANAFLQEDLEVLQILADQIALAINNTQLLQGSQRALEELERLYGQEISQAWKQELTGKEITYQYNPVGFALRSPGVETLDDYRGEFGHKLTKDITFRGQVIGSIGLQREVTDEGWSEEEELLVEEILEQTALALENARLVDQIRLRSDQIHLLQDITALGASLMDENELLSSAAQKLFKGLELLQCSVVLYDENRNYGTILAKANEDEDLPVVGSIIALDEDEINQLLMDKKEIMILYDVKNDPRSSIYSLAFSPKDAQTTIILPLIVRGEVIGIINLDVEDPEREINDEDLNLFNQISGQVSTAIDSTRLLSAEQRGRQAAAAMLEISQIASSTLDLDQVLLEITQSSAAAVQAHRCTISLIDKEENTLKAIMSRFADSHHHDETLWKIFKSMEADTLDNFPLFQQVVEEKKHMLFDVASQPHLMPSNWVEPFDIKKLLAVPLISQDEVFGFLTFDHVDANESFTNEQIELAQTIAGQIGTTIENAKLFSHTVRRAERERLVTEITTKIRASNDPRTILQTAMSELRNTLTRSRTQIPTGSDGDVDQKKIANLEKSDQEESFDMEGK
jgi:GAF domain-containing protein